MRVIADNFNFLKVLIGFLYTLWDFLYMLGSVISSHAQNECLYAFHYCMPFTSENDHIVILIKSVTNRKSNENQVCFICEIFTTQIPVTPTEGVLLIFLQSEVEKLLAWLGIDPTTLDLSSQPLTTWP